MRKKAAGMLLVIGLCFVSAGVMAADNQDVSIYIVETQAKIKNCDYKKYKDAAEVLEADIASLEEQIATAQQNRKKAEETGDSLQVMRMDLVISNCKKEMEEKKETLTEYQLQMDMDIYYIDNKDKLAEDQKAKNQYNCYCSRLTIAKYNAQLTYLGAAQTELEQKLKIEKNKLELGYTTALEVNKIQSALDRILLMKKEAEEEINFQKDMLALYGEEEILIDLPQKLEELQDDFVDKFCSDSTQIKFYEQQITAYSNYIDNSEESDEELEKIRLQLELAQLNKQQYRVELERYVKQTEKSYKQAKLKTEEYDSEIAVIEQTIKNSELLYEKGRLREIDVIEVKTEKARLEYERTCAICDAQQSRYILEHQIENTDFSYGN